MPIKFQVFILSVLFSFLLFEIGFRLYPVTYSPLWGIEKGIQDEKINNKPEHSKIGKFKFREKWPEAGVFEKNKISVLFLGDSFTWGTGISIDSDRFTDLLEQEINHTLAGSGSNFKIHIFNAGRRGSNPNRWYRFFKTLDPIYRPRTVFAVFF